MSDVDDGMFPERSPEERAARKSFSTRIGHVKRRVMRDERLKGEMLEFALIFIGDEVVANKLKEGTKLTDYEKHLLVDVWLPHARLAGP